MSSLPFLSSWLFFYKGQLNTTLDYFILLSHYCWIQKGYIIAKARTGENGVALILYKKEGLNVTVSQRVDAYSYYFTVVINNGKENRDFMAISDYFVDGKFVNMESFIRKFCGKINKVVRKHKRKSRPPPPPPRA
ncbi:unnamed protein product [Rotaria sp. Silwood2]|nr:unnamed protein product [Rotaria sp. Silwood2]CAF2817706.1 unnamed protein product [Rotaria sp. Silwood2]CAF3512154.1 unnamed protein product [Rotaria sp. Silwood2]CAF4409748.1 unnamed protein product [Rotaria sp. Silwood2]CAF4737784.1 unnamed protein product [Rotaria sp. Silwood2]